MYLKSGGSYYRGTEQCSRRAPFLILVQSKDLPIGPDNFRALVRKVALQQLGNFMMGTARVKGKSITLSGSYGNDGLPKTIDHETWETAVPVPKELYEKWSKGGGWNSCGSEAHDFRKWALSMPEFKKYLD